VQPLLRQEQLELPEGQNPQHAKQATLLEQRLKELEKADLHWKLGLDRVVLAYSLSCVNKHQRDLFIGNSAHTLTAVILFL